MTVRRSAVLAVALGVLAIGCGADASGSESTTSDTTAETTIGPSAPPPAELLDATLVYFDGDGTDERITDPPAGSITDRAELDAFVRRYVDGEPALDGAATEALAAANILVGGVVSSGCFAADSARLALVNGDVRLVPVGLPAEDPELACVRAITSVALISIDPADLPDDATVQGT